MTASPRTHPRLPDAAERVALLPAAGVLALWGALMPAAGGFDPQDWLPAGLALIGLLVVSAVGARGLIPPSPVVRAALGALAALTALAFASIGWSDAPGSTWEAADLLLTTLLAAWALALVPWRAATAAAFLVAFGAVAALVCAVTFADAASSPDLTSRFTDGRFNQPLDYPNTAAAFAVMAAIPLLVVAARPGAHPATKAATQGLATFLFAFALLPQSRGSILGGAAALAVVLLVSGNRWRVVVHAVLAAVAVAVFSGPLLEVYDTAFSGGRVSAALDDAGVALVFAALVGTLGGAALAAAEARVVLGERGRRRARLAGVATAAVLLVAAGGLALAASDRITGAVADQWDALTHPGEEFRGASEDGSGSRLTDADPLERYDYWRVSVDAFRSAPVAGIGAGAFAHRYAAERRYPKPSKYPHNLPLRVLGEHGILGLLALAALLAAVARGLGADWRRMPEGDRAVGVAAVGVATYFLAHASFDWLEAYPVLAGPAAAFLVVALAVRDRSRRLEVLEGATAPRPSGRRGPGRVAVAGAAIAAVLAGGAFAAPWLAGRYQERAEEGWRSDPQAAFADLGRAADLNPLSPEPPLVAGLIAVQLDDAARARLAFAEALEREEGWVAHVELALLDAAAGDRAAAQRHLDAAGRVSRLEPAIEVARAALAGRTPVDPAAVTRKLLESSLVVADELS